MGKKLAIQGSLIRATRGEKLATMFVGASSPFPGHRNDLSYVNAVMVVTEQGIMGSATTDTNGFEPGAPVSGVDALSGVHALRNVLAHG
ncbi:hypothetical protein D3OALGA1CA_2464 [Olavius algarvensis associated proteobacterium Delta 3]|nr:hypothetical protein D3OALGA1CA_2464 [Olavius algarvensis associated proteobacterium Delta 3]CAB5155009.1 hypothetical protein D3OALGB2SA_5045 [Olavius algarvensis associated proteobacterium Delta 3]